VPGLRVGVTYWGGADRVPKGRNVLHSAPYISWLYNNARVKRRALSLDSTRPTVDVWDRRPVAPCMLFVLRALNWPIAAT